MSSQLPDFSRAEYVEAPHEEGAASVAVVEGTDSAAFARAVWLGLGGAALGCVIYAIVGMWVQIGYVAILVGVLVGSAMMQGSGGVGGRRYQVAAVLLTYFAASTAFVLDVLWVVRRHGGSVGEFAAHNPLFLAAYVLFGPVLRLRHPVSGGLGLLILFFGVQAAWRIAKGGSPGLARLRRYKPESPLGLR